MIPGVIPILYQLAGHGLTEHAAHGSKQGPRGLALKRHTAQRTGDLTCPGVDLDAFRYGCRAPVFADAWNYWLAYRSSYDGTSKADLESRARGFLSRINAKMKGKIRQESIAVTESDACPWGAPSLYNVGMCGVDTSMRASEFSPPFYRVHFRFVYRGSEQTIPWPVIKRSDAADAATLIVGNDDCPVEASWILQTVFEPSTKDVPAQSSDSTLDPFWSNKVPDAPSPAIKIVVGGVALLAVGIGAAYVLRTFK